MTEVEILTKRCKHCEIEKYQSEFYTACKGKSLQPYCKPCDKIRKKKWQDDNKEAELIKNKDRYRANVDKNSNYNAENYAKNREKLLARSKDYAKNNKEKVNEKNRKYRKLQKYKDNASAYSKKIMAKKKEEDPDLFKKMYSKRKALLDTPEKIEEYNAKQRAFKKKYPERYKNYEKTEASRELKRISQRKWQRNKVGTSIEFKIIKNLRSRIRLALKGKVKSDSTINIIGCPISDFKIYLELQFTNGMSWDNYGRFGWHIDHKIPVSWFNMANPNCQKLAFSYKNHQPLWWQDNLKKNNKFHHPIENI